MNIEKIKVNTALVILGSVAQKKHPFRALIDWIKMEKGISARRLAVQSGGFVPAALTEQLKKSNPNPGFEVIHGIAKVAGISEQVVIDACLGRPFLRGEKLEEAVLKEILRKYQMIRPENRGRALQGTINTLADLVDETLDVQTKEDRSD